MRRAAALVLGIALLPTGCWWGSSPTHKHDSYVPYVPKYDIGTRPDSHAVTPPRVCSKVTCVTGEACVSTLAGDGTSGYLDGLAATARFDHPWAVAVDGQGWVYVSDHHNARVRVIRNGVVSTLAGSSSKGSVDGPSDKARFSGIQGIDVDLANGTVYVADREARKVRVISQGYVSTLALSGTEETFDPTDVAIRDGLLHVVDFGNYNCWTCASRWPPHIGRVQQGGGALIVLPETYTEDPATADLKAVHYLAQPQSVAVGVDGKIYMPTTKGIRVLAAGGAKLKEIEIHQYFGLVFELADLAVDAQGRMFGAIALNHRIAQVGADEKVTIIPPVPAVVENASKEYGCVDGPASVARFYMPQGVAVDAGGRRIYVADTGNERIRVIDLP